MCLTFKCLHEGYYVAPADGSTFPKNGIYLDDLWTVRTTPALLERSPDAPYRIEDPDSYIVGESLTLGQAIIRAKSYQQARHTGAWTL